MTANQSAITFDGDPVTTTDETVTTIATIALSDESVYAIEAVVIGIKSDGTARHHAHIEGTFYRDDAGNATQQGATTSIHTIDSGDEYAVAFVIDGNNVLVKVTGVAATTIVWGSFIKYFRTYYTA